MDNNAQKLRQQFQNCLYFLTPAAYLSFLQVSPITWLTLRKRKETTRSTSNSSNRIFRRWKAAVFKLEPQSSSSIALTAKQCLTVSNALYFLPVTLKVHARTPSEKKRSFDVWMCENSNYSENNAVCTWKNKRKAHSKAACFQETLVSF